MERYTEITVAELLEAILKDEINNIYFQEGGQLYSASNYQWSIGEFKKYKWFRREVIE